MRISAVIGVLLIALGVVAMTYQGFTFFTHERVVDAGPFAIDISKPHTIVFNPLLGLVALIVGAVLLIAGRRSPID
jgi:hypothetical protein